MTTSLLVAREYIRNFYVKHEEYAVPLLKFVLALISLLAVNAKLGYMSQIDGAAAVLITALVCSFMPRGFTLLAAAAFVTLHLYEVSLECAGVALVVFLLLFLLYLRFTPKGAVLVLITPLLFAVKIPYAAPILAGLLGNPLSAVAVVCGVIVYYLISYMSMNASLLSATAVESMVTRIREILDGVFGNREMLIIAAAFVVTTILVYLVRRLSVDYSWTIAIISGALLDIVVILVGDLIYNADFFILGVLLGSVGAVCVSSVVQFFRFNLDYSRTEKVQFEDDEYYYYVKAVPKLAVTTPEKKVKKITTQRSNRRVRHTNTRDAAYRQRD